MTHNIVYRELCPASSARKKAMIQFVSNAYGMVPDTLQAKLKTPGNVLLTVDSQDEAIFISRRLKHLGILTDAVEERSLTQHIGSALIGLGRFAKKLIGASSMPLSSDNIKLPESRRKELQELVIDDLAKLRELEHIIVREERKQAIVGIIVLAVIVTTIVIIYPYWPSRDYESHDTSSYSSYSSEGSSYSGNNSDHVHVRGYTRQDGTNVESYTRRNPSK